MKVNRDQGSYTLDDIKNKKASQSEETNESQLTSSLDKPDLSSDPSYNVHLSSSSRSHSELKNKASQIAKQTPDVREHEIERFKKQILDKTYRVSSEQIADGIIAEALKDRISEDLAQTV